MGKERSRLEKRRQGRGRGKMEGWGTKKRIRVAHNQDVVSSTEGILEDGACPKEEGK